VASFVGFAPLSAPRLVGVISLDEPWPLYHGGQAAAPVFAAIARQVLPYWGVPPEPPPPPADEPPLLLPPPAARVLTAALPPRPDAVWTIPAPLAEQHAAAAVSLDTGEGPADPLDGPADPLVEPLVPFPRIAERGAASAGGQH
jgi:hypothetical protein